MTSDMKTVLVVGGTSGIGEAFVRRFHALGKKVIATGRRQELLGNLKTELSGIDTRQVRFLSLCVLCPWLTKS